MIGTSERHSAEMTDSYGSRRECLAACMGCFAVQEGPGPCLIGIVGAHVHQPVGAEPPRCSARVVLVSAHRRAPRGGWPGADHVSRPDTALWVCFDYFVGCFRPRRESSLEGRRPRLVRELPSGAPGRTGLAQQYERKLPGVPQRARGWPPWLVEAGGPRDKTARS